MSKDAIHAQLARIERSTDLPLVLLINFGIFQYLVLLFHKKARRQPYVCLLLLVSVLSVLVLVPYATQDEATVGAMNDVSESCLALMLLVQTSFALTTGSPKVVNEGATSTDGCLDASTSEVPAPSPALKSQGRLHCAWKWSSRHSSALHRVLKVLADVLIVVDCLSIALGLLGIFSPHKLQQFGGADAVNTNAEVLTLVYTFVYRFGALALHKGSVRSMLREDALEFVAHVVFAMHEYPFMVALDATGVDCEAVQILFMRLTLLPCVWMTIGEHHYRHPTQSQLDQLPVAALQDLIQRASVAAETKSQQSRTNSLVRPLDDAPLVHAAPRPLPPALPTESKP